LVQAEPTLANVLTRLLAVAVVSLFGALTIAYLAYSLIQFLPSFGVVLNKTESQAVIISFFVISFLFLFVTLLRRYVPTIQSLGGPLNLSSYAQQKAPLPDDPADFPDEDDLESNLEDEAAAGTAVDDEAADDEVAEDSDDTEDPDTNAEEDTESVALEPPGLEGWEEDDKEPNVRKKKGSLTKAKKKPDVSAEMLKFICDSLEPLAKAGRPLNAFNRFGLTLFFAGAGEYMASKHRMSDEEITDILCSHV
jgi:adenylate cyclase